MEKDTIITKENVGPGTTSPSARLSIIPNGRYGIGTTAPQDYIDLRAKSLSDSWRKLIKLTIYMFFKKIGIKIILD
jgi:hypothetical protein